MKKRFIGVSIKLLVTAGLFILLFRPQTFGLRPDQFGGVTPVKLWQELKSAEPIGVFFWLTLAALVRLSGMCAGIFRWRLLLRGQGLTIPPLRFLRLYPRSDQMRIRYRRRKTHWVYIPHFPRVPDVSARVPAVSL
jgi:hypothetical protein